MDFILGAIIGFGICYFFKEQIVEFFKNLSSSNDDKKDGE